MPVLRFTPQAWAKLQFLRDLGDTEIGGFGITDGPDDLLVIDFELVRQECTPTHVKFDDDAVADFFEDQVELGRVPAQFARVWIHTHPGSSPNPSITDEETFATAFGAADWAVMFILAKGGQTYARLRLNVGPGAQVELPCKIAWDYEFDCADHEAWLDEYRECVRVYTPPKFVSSRKNYDTQILDEKKRWDDKLNRLKLSSQERRAYADAFRDLDRDDDGREYDAGYYGIFADEVDNLELEFDHGHYLDANGDEMICQLCEDPDDMYRSPLPGIIAAVDPATWASLGWIEACPNCRRYKDDIEAEAALNTFLEQQQQHA